MRLDFLDLAAQPRLRPRPIVHLQVHADARAVSLKRLEAGGDHAHHVFPFTFENRAHGRELVGDAAPVDDIDDARDVSAETLALAMRGHGDSSRTMNVLRW